MAGTPLSFVIEEATGNDRIRVELKDHDLPFGRARRGAAFDLGGPVETNDVKLDGRIAPIIHTRYEDFHPTVVKGHLRDHFTGVEGHAETTRQQLEKIKTRKRAVNLSIGKLKWTAFFKESKFGYEGENDLTYELNFRVMVGPQSKTTLDDNVRSVEYVDLVANARAVLIADAAAFAALSMTRIATIQIRLAYDDLDSALDDAEVAARNLENAGDRADAEATAMTARCQSVKDKADTLMVVAQTYPAASAVPRVSASTVAAYQQQQANCVANALAVRASMQRLQIAAHQRILKGKQLYRVAVGDTPESIAAKKLGNGSRAGEIGYRSQDLTAGRIIFIPKAA